MLVLEIESVPELSASIGFKFFRGGSDKSYKLMHSKMLGGSKNAKLSELLCLNLNKFCSKNNYFSAKPKFMRPSSIFRSNESRLPKLPLLFWVAFFARKMDYLWVGGRLNCRPRQRQRSSSSSSSAAAILINCFSSLISLLKLLRAAVRSRQSGRNLQTFNNSS